MTSTSRYHQIMYWAQGIILKHYQIRNGTHEILLKYCLIRDNAQNVLSKPYCEHVYSSINILLRIAPLNFIKKGRADDRRCFRVRCSIQAKSIIQSPEWMCAQAINQLRQFLTPGLKKHYPRSEDGLFSRTKQQHCSEVIKNDHEVARA